MVLSTEPRAALEVDLHHRSHEAIALIPHAIAVKHNVLAFGVEADALHVLVPRGIGRDVIDRIRSVSGRRVVSREAPAEYIRWRVAADYNTNEASISDTASSPAVRAVNAMHDTAIEARASDIHVEPGVTGGRIRIRVDGVLREMRTIAAELFAPFISRIKLLASMDIAERRQPQDGGYSISSNGREFAARVSSVPTVDGERLVIRLLDVHAQVPEFVTLGMSDSLLKAYRAIIHGASGFVVVCGPVGSGKTTTLYASLGDRNVDGQHLCSVEDPVEVRIPGIAQVQVNAKAGITFAAAMRAFLRQDPNVIALGEMRDEESASVAMSAALSGQLLLTTLHANTAPGAIERLVELGLSRSTLATGLSAILAQRLVRLLCNACKRQVPLSSRDALLLGLLPGINIYEAAGCEMCSYSGYVGRLGIFELLTLNANVRDAIASKLPAAEIARRACACGYVPLSVSAPEHIVSGMTSVAEIYRMVVLGEAG